MPSAPRGKAVIAAIFEVSPRQGAAARYFEMAAALNAELEGIDGFMSVERFERVTRRQRIRAWR
jgi:heme-degrading monooxygenase HmoA